MPPPPSHPSRLPPSIYRVPGETAPVPAPAPSPRVEAAILLWVLGCAMLRFGLFVFRGERFGVDPVLALAAAGAAFYTLTRLLRT